MPAMVAMKKEKPSPVPILFLNYSMEVGGIEALIQEFTCYLQTKGYMPLVAVFSSGGSLEKALKSSGVEVFDLQKRRGIDFHSIYRLRKLVFEKGVKILHTHNYSAWFYGVLASIGIRDVRHIHTEHSNIGEWRRVCLERMLCRFTDKVVCVSDIVKRFMIDKKMPVEKLTLIYNGVDTNRFAPDPKQRAIYRKKLGIPDEARVIGIVARLVPVKDHVTLLRAFHLLSVKFPDARLLLVGDGRLRKDLEAESRALGVDGRVHFIGERQDIPELLNVMDVFVLSSLSEGHNVSLIEAMSAGLAVVATDVGGNSENIQEGETGFLVPPGNPEEMSRKLGILLENPSLRERMGANSRRRITEDFDFDTMMTKYLALYDEMMTGTGAR